VIGAKGAAISALTTQFFVASVQFYYAYNTIHLSIVWKEINKYILLIITLLATSLLLLSAGLSHGLIVFIQLLLGGSLLFILSFIDIKQLKKTLLFRPPPNNYP
jgi:hypothetical protein